jgi:hypothetical protein
MKTYNDLPLLTMDFNPEVDEGVNFIALVERPAIQRGFLAFSAAQSQPMAFAITSEDRHIVTGPLMLADTPIYRRQSIGGGPVKEFYATVSPPVIERVAQNFYALGYHKNVNAEHDPTRQIDGVVMFESFINDSARGIAPPKGFEDAPEGSWFGSFVIDNPEVWQQVKAGTFTGFSVEGFFHLLQTPDPYEAAMAELQEILKNVE